MGFFNRKSGIVSAVVVLLGIVGWLTLGHRWPMRVASTPHTPNQLIHAQSPYLLEHAHDPVAWYPWSSQAFTKARRENRPIFLSIGYSSCHWCHVMQHEDFDDPKVAGLMNKAFVSILVDREERPDIDRTYMAVSELLTGGGGWPLTIIMTPDKKPFFAASYIPRQSRFGQTGMLQLIPYIQRLWETKRADLERSADQIVKAVDSFSASAPGESLNASTLKTAYLELAKQFDPLHGGFGAAPKFPNASSLFFLLRYGKRSGDARALDMVEKTLHAMRAGGIWDHVGFGFHRYAVDDAWRMPHFEKMLYDQALLAMTYTEAYQATGREDYGRTAREIFSYMERDMKSPGGAFYAAEDADSQGQEGKFYLWTESEIRKVLGGQEAELVIKVFNLTRQGNFPEEPGENILYRTQSLPQIARELKLSEPVLQKRLAEARQKLFAAREKRPHPFKDAKILASWNGLVIAALAEGAQVFADPAYAASAQGAADFILQRMQTPEGRLLHSDVNGQAAVAGTLDDYAFLTWGLLNLYEANFKVADLEAALDLNAALLRHFWDDRDGGFYFTADDAEHVLARQKELDAGVVPSGNAVAMLNLLRLSLMTGNAALQQKAARIGMAFSKQLAQEAGSFPEFMTALDFALGPAYEVVIAGKPDAPGTRAMLKALRTQFIPNKVVLFRPADESSPEISRLAEFTKDQSSAQGRATAYVCLNFQCKLPTSQVRQMLEDLNSKPLWRARRGLNK